MATGDVYALNKKSGETSDFLCSVCKQKDNNKCKAEKYCSNCQDYFCLTCVKNIHNYVPALSSHNIVDKGQNSSGSGSVFPAVPTEKCGRHGQQPIAMYCQNHDELGCHACIALDHRICKDTAYIPDFVKNNPQLSDTKNIEIKLESLLKSFQEIQDTFVQQKRFLLSRKTEEIKKIHKFREDINKMLDDLEQKSLEKTYQRCERVTNKIEDAIKAIQDLTARVKSAQYDLKSAGDNVSQQFVSMKRAGKVASTAEQEMNNIDTYFNTASINFAKEQTLLTLLNRMKDLGHDAAIMTQKKDIGNNTEIYPL